MSTQPRPLEEGLAQPKGIVGIVVNECFFGTAVIQVCLCESLFPGQLWQLAIPALVLLYMVDMEGCTDSQYLAKSAGSRSRTLF